MGIFDHNPGNKPTPIPPPQPNFNTYINVEPTSGVSGALYIDDGSVIPATGQQHVEFNNISPNVKGWGGYVRLTAPGYQTSNLRVSVQENGLVPGGVQLVPAFPAIPTRDAKGLAKLHFGGIWWNHSIYGRMPLFEACFMWLGATDRQALYAAKRAAGDTHLLVAVPSGLPLYDEANQPYSPDRFGPLAYNGAALVANVTEAVQAGFIPVLFMQEDYSISIVAIAQVINDLQNNTPDLVPYCIFSPGWDGVFYGWEPSHTLIPGWASTARSTYKGDQHNLMLFLEHDPGHIPLGEGGGDYQSGGDMQNFDIIAGEFSPWIRYGNPAGDAVWQICARMACPNGYHRPADQPAGDDPNPPNYLPGGGMSPRGRFYYWVFETGVYEFVHFGDDSFFAPQRAYYANLGCETIC